MHKGTVIEFVNSLSEEELKFLLSRLTDRLQGDVAEALEFMSHFSSMDSILSEATSGDDFFDLFDQITDIVQKECKKKGLLARGSAA